MLIRKAIILITSLTLLAFTSFAVAQDEEENDGLAQVVRISAKDGQDQDLEKAITEYHHYMGDKEGAWHYQWYSIMTGPDAGDYIARSGGHNWEDFDAENEWEDEANARFTSDVQPYIADADVLITRPDKELGMWPDSIEGYQYFSVTEWHIMPGKNRAFNEGLKKIDGMLKEGGWPNHYAFVYNVSGGYGNTVTLVSPRKSFADMAPKEPAFIDILNEVMGEEEAQAFLADWGKTYKSGQNILLAYRPELSDYGQED
jgi:hypothetical protein